MHAMEYHVSMAVVGLSVAGGPLVKTSKTEK